MPRAYNYTHNITINYKETGAKNLGKNIASVSVATDKNTKSINTQNQAMAKTTKSTGDAVNQFKGYAKETFNAGRSTQSFSDATEKSTASQSKWGQSLRQNRGLLFGGTGLTSSLVEAAGMYGIYTDALVRKNEAQAEVNRLEAEGMQGTKEYTDAQQELQQQTRAFTMFQRNMALSMFDTVTFVTMLASSLLPRMGGATAKVTTAFKSLFGVMRAGQVTQLATGITPLANAMGTLPAKVEKTTGALGRLKGAMMGLGLSNPFFIAITAIGALLGAVALNVGGLRDKFNELGIELGKTHAFLRPLLDALGGFGDLLGGLAGQNNIANATDQFGNLTQEAEDFRAKVIQTDRALMAMFENLSRAQISEMFATMKATITDVLSRIEFTENPIRKGIEKLLGQTNPELEKGLQEMVKLWDVYGDDIMGAKMVSREGQEAQKAVSEAFDKMLKGGAEQFEANLKDLADKIRVFFDFVEKEKNNAPELTLRVKSPDELKSDLDQAVRITEDGAKRIIVAFDAYLDMRRAHGKEYAQEHIQTIIDTNGMVDKEEIAFFQRSVTRYEDDKEAETKAAEEAAEKKLEIEEQKQENHYKAMERGFEIRDRVTAKYNEMEEEKAKEQAKKLQEIEEQKIKNHYDALKKGEEIKDRVREKALSDENVNEEQTARAYDRIKQEREYNKALEAFLPTYESLINKKEQLIPLVDAIAAKYPLIGKSGAEAMTDLEGMTKKTTEKIIAFDQALLDAVKTSADFGKTMADNVIKVIGEEILNKKGGLKGKIDFGDIAKDLDITKKAAKRLTLPVVVSTVIQNKSEALDSIDEFINALQSKWISGRSKLKIDNILGEDFESDMDNLLKKALKAFENAIPKDDRTAQDNAFIKFLKESMKIDWEDLSPEEAVAKLQEIKARLEKEGFGTGEDEGEEGIAADLNKQLGLIATPPEVQQKVSSPVVNAFTDISAEADSMESDLDFVFVGIESTASTTATNIQTSLTNAFTQVENAGQELEGRLEDNFDTIWESVDELIDKVADLSQELEDIPNIHRTVTIERKTIGGGGGGAFFSGGGFDFREGGIISGLARGGIINKAQMYRGIRIGEHNKPEAVIPLSNPKNLAKKALDIDAPINFNLRIDGNRVLRPTNIWETVRPMLGKYQSNFG